MKEYMNKTMKQVEILKKWKTRNLDVCQKTKNKYE